MTPHDDDSAMVPLCRRMGQRALQMARMFKTDDRPMTMRSVSLWHGEARVCFALAARHQLAANRHHLVGRVAWLPGA